MQVSVKTGVPVHEYISLEDRRRIWEVSESSGMPPGLNVHVVNEDDVEIGGTPTQSGRWTFVFQGNSLPDFPQPPKYFTLVIGVEAGQTQITILPLTLPVATIGKAYRQPIRASGGREPYQYRISAGFDNKKVPGGLSIGKDTGVLSGTPTTAGLYEFDVGATDADGNGATSDSPSGWITYRLSVEEAPKPVVITLSPTTLPDGHVGHEYQQQISASGGTAPYTYTSREKLPPGLSIDQATGVLSGTLTTAGLYTFELGASDKHTPFYYYFRYSLTVEEAPKPVVITLSPSTLPDGHVGHEYHRQQISASGGTAPYTYKLWLPDARPWLGDQVKFDPNSGLLDVHPILPGTYKLKVGATDKNGNGGRGSGEGVDTNGWKEYTLKINPSRKITLIPRADEPGEPYHFPPGMVGREYEQFIQAKGGIPSYVFHIASGTSSAWLQLDGKTGRLHGKPDSVDGSEFKLELFAIDDGGLGDASDHYAYQGRILRNLLVGFTGEPSGQTGQDYLGQIFAEGGTTPYTYDVTGLPDGLSLSGDTISGKPTRAGSFDLHITVTDHNGFKASCDSHLEVTQGPVGEARVTFDEPLMYVEHLKLVATGTVRGPKEGAVADPVAAVGVSWTGQISDRSVTWDKQPKPGTGDGHPMSFSVETPYAEVKGMLAPVLIARTQSGAEKLEHFVFPNAVGLIDVSVEVDNTPVQASETPSGSVVNLGTRSLTAGTDHKVVFRIIPKVGILRMNVHADLRGVQVRKQDGKTVTTLPLPSDSESGTWLTEWNGTGQLLALKEVNAGSQYTLTFPLHANPDSSGSCVFTLTLSDPETVSDPSGRHTAVNQSFLSKTAYMLHLSL